MHKAELPGRLPLRRLVQELLDEPPGATGADDETGARVSEACEAVLGALTA